MRNAHVLLPLSLAVACEGEPACAETSSEIGFHDEGPWGATPAEVFSAALNPKGGSLTWRGGGDLVEMSPSSGTTTFALSLAYEGGTIRAVDVDGGGGRLACTARIELDADLTFSTDDGAFDDAWTVTALAEPTFGNPVGLNLDPEQVPLAGTLSFTRKEGVEEEYDDSGFGLNFRWNWEGEGSVSGDLVFGVVSEERDGKHVTEEGTLKILAEFAGGPA